MFRVFHCSEHAPLRPAATPAAERVLETLERCDLNPEDTLLVGSAALALYGVTLSPHADRDVTNPVERPGDVDVLSTASYAEDVFDGREHAGFAVRKETENTNFATFLRVNSAPLRLDIITYYKGGSMARFDARFRARIARDSREIEGAHGIRVATERKLGQELAGRYRDPKAQRDLAELHRAISR